MDLKDLPDVSDREKQPATEADLRNLIAILFSQYLVSGDALALARAIDLGGPLAGWKMNRFRDFVATVLIVVVAIVGAVVVALTLTG